MASGDVLIAPSVTRRLIGEFAAWPGPPGVTEREREVLVLVGRVVEYGDRRELHISVATAKAHVARLFTRPAARDRVHLVIMAYEFGLVAA